MMKIKLKHIAVIGFFAFFVSSCSVGEWLIEDIDAEDIKFDDLYYEIDEQNEADVDESKKYNAVVKKDEYPSVQTTKGANMLDLETPLRCFVNWGTQEMISSIPYNMPAFNLVRNGINDHLPKFEVNVFSFDTMSAEKALLKLTKEAEIKLVAKDAPYAGISAENLRGDFTDVVNMITDAAEVYYTYNATNKTLRIFRKANFSLFIPRM